MNIPKESQINKVVFTHWTLPETRNHGRILPFSGFKDEESRRVFFELSVLIAKHHFDDVVIHTDDFGARYLESLKLPVEIICSHNDFMKDCQSPAQSWAFAKIFTYGLQEKPFAHVDFDVLLGSGLRPWVRKGQVVVQHFETHDYVQDGVLAVMKECQVPAWFREVHPGDWFGSNAGIIGYNDLDACDFYAQSALKFAFDNLKWAISGRNFMWIEQVLVGVSALYLEKEIRPMLMGFHHQRYLQLSGYRHVWGTMKHDENIIKELKQELEDYKNGQHRFLHRRHSEISVDEFNGTTKSIEPSANPAGPTRDFSVPVAVPFATNGFTAVIRPIETEVSSRTRDDAVGSCSEPNKNCCQQKGPRIIPFVGGSR